MFKVICAFLMISTMACPVFMPIKDGKINTKRPEINSPQNDHVLSSPKRTPSPKK